MNLSSEELLFCEDMEFSDDSLSLSCITSSSSDTDSTSDEDAINDIEIALISSKNKRNCILKYLKETVPSYSDDEFVMHFRVTRSIYEFLCKKYEESEEYNKFEKRKVNSPEMHIALFLWFAGHRTYSYRALADRFDLPIGSVCYMIERITFFISTNLSTFAIRWPTEQEKEQSSDYFKVKTGFTGAIGAIDGTRIEILPPKGCKDEYIDSKGNVSICLQGICDQHRKFLDIFVGFPGSVHDSRVFVNSRINSQLKERCGKYFLLADSAYASSNFLVTPYKDNGHLTREKKEFNRRHSVGRVVIEHAFGVLKQRFQQLYFCKLRGMKKICHFVRACVVLHNLCNDSFVELTLINTEPDESDAEEEIDDERNCALREKLTQELAAQNRKEK